MSKLQIMVITGTVFLVLAAVFIRKYNNGSNNYKVLQINNKKLVVEIADSQKEKQKGLSGRNSMASDHGMLFSFNEPSYNTFWMKDMAFNLDFIFVNDGFIVQIVENVPYPAKADDEPQVIESDVLTDAVIEVNAGFVKDNKIQIGDEVKGGDMK